MESPPVRTDATDSVLFDATSSHIGAGMQKIQRREWWLWSSAVLITLLLTLSLVSFVFPLLNPYTKDVDATQLTRAIRGLVGLVLLFDIYVIYQQLQIYRMRRRLIEKEELFRLISENAADMIAVLDAQGRRLYNSPAYERVLGLSPQELQQTSVLEQVHPDDRPTVEQAAKQALETGMGRTIEYRMRHKDGSWRFLESTASAAFNEKGTVERLIVVNRDVTGRRRLEEQVRQSQKMEAVGRLSGGIAHDFNNLLGVIIGYSEILQEKLADTTSLKSSVDEILKAGRRAASLTRQLLAFSRLQVLEPRVLDLNSVVSDMEKMLVRLVGEDLELNTVLDPSLGRIKADQGQLEQIVMNLIVNARDAMPHGGRLTIETSNIGIDEVFADSRPFPVKTGLYIRLSVTDTGIGMDSATQAHIFEPFFTTKEKGKGTGLGLATVYGVVKQSGGYIDVYSELGIGTTFKIYLPRVDEPISSENSATLLDTLRGNETILLVEDEQSLRTLSRNLLELCGYTVLEAQNGAEAVEISKKHDGPIHLLLTDMVMPGMNGRTLGQVLTNYRSELRVLYMSGYTGQSFSGSGALDPGSHFLQKPFTRESLARKVREALERVSETAAE